MTDSAMQSAFDRLAALEANIGKVFIGEKRVVQQLLIGLLAGGHVLIQDVPGVGKTTIAKALAKSLACEFSRLQFTPDLLPSDVLGVSIYDQDEKQFRFIPGPVFSNILLADELNRTPPRTQSALLECMSERQVSVDGQTRSLRAPFIVLATMNPVEYHGVYDLPESQLDRFMLRLEVGYPDRESERAIFRAQKTKHPLESIEAVVTAEQVVHDQGLVRQIRVDPSLENYVLDLIQATRTHPEVLLGASPRATLSLFRASQAHAFLERRDFVTPDDIKAMARPVLAHRLGGRGGTGEAPKGVLDQLLNEIPVPSGA